MVKIATFKHEDEHEGEPIGPVFVIDSENPPTPSWERPRDHEAEGAKVEVLEWMTLSQARELAERNGWQFEED
jgi:hypothetical protein